MLTRFLSHLQRIASTNRPTGMARPRTLNLEVLEAREVPATLIGLDRANNLLRFDSAAPATVQSVTAITGLSTAGERVVGIDFRPRTGQLYALSVNPDVVNTNGRLYTINALTGAATRVGTGTIAMTNDTASAYGFDFNPTVDAIRIVDTANASLRVNPNTGLLISRDLDLSTSGDLLPPIAVPSSTISSAPIPPVDPSKLNSFVKIDEVAYDRNFDGRLGTAGTTLYAISANSGTLRTVGGLNQSPSPNTGALNTVGALNVTIDPFGFVGFDIVSTRAAPAGEAYAVFDGDATAVTATGLYRIDLTTGAATLVGTVGSGTTALIGLTAVPEGALVVGSGAGATGDVRVLDPNSGAVQLLISNPFAGFRGGVRVATGDVTRDGVPDVIAAATGVNNGHVKAFDGRTGAELISFLAFPGFNGTVSVGSGDVNGDGFADVLVAASGANANGHVKAFSGVDGSLLASFFAYPRFTGNVTVAAGDFDNDGTDEIVTTAASNGHTKVFVGSGGSGGQLFTATTLPNFRSSFLAFGSYSGDVSVAVGDVNGDGVADFVLGSGAGVPLNVRVVDGTNGAPLSSFIATGFGAGYTGGGSVGVADFNRDGTYELVVTPNGGTQANVLALDPFGNPLGSFPAFANFQGGASGAGARY